MTVAQRSESGSTRVLVVDDERNMRTTLADILEDAGFDVSTADCGEKAVKMCRKRAFDAVLMDVRMPGIDGVEAFRLIKRKDQAIRVIMMSAYSMHELQSLAMREGAIGFLKKPLDLARVIALIGEASGAQNL